MFHACQFGFTASTANCRLVIMPIFSYFSTVSSWLELHSHPGLGVMVMQKQQRPCFILLYWLSVMAAALCVFKAVCVDGYKTAHLICNREILSRVCLVCRPWPLWHYGILGDYIYLARCLGNDGRMRDTEEQLKGDAECCLAGWMYEWLACCLPASFWSAQATL